MMRDIFAEFSLNAGLTLVEMFVALFLFALLMSLAMTVNLSLGRIILVACAESRLHDSGQFILTTILDDLHSCGTVVMSDSAFLVTEGSIIDTIVYERKEGDILRNGRRLNLDEVTCTALDLKTEAFENPTPAGFTIRGGAKYEDKLVNIYIRLSYKNKSRSFKTSVRLKNVCHIY